MNSADRDAWTKHVADRPRVGLAVVIDKKRRGKYGAQQVIVDGIRFDSAKEATRYSELKLLQAAGSIAHLELQPCFPLQVVELYREGPPWTIRHCGVYTADFRYVDCASGEVVIEDTKSGPTKTEAYQLRKRIAEAVHGMTIREL